MTSFDKIDRLLRRAVEIGDVPGVVAIAATGHGIVYEGAFGRLLLPAGPQMTRDTVFRIASMTKAVTSVAAMQLVEAGRLELDQPVELILPELAAPQVLEGFDSAGAARLRPAARPITLRHLLTHTAGFGYEMLNTDLARYIRRRQIPSIATGELASLRLPLLFDPGEGWQYGINIDWVGRIVETVAGQTLDDYFRQHICAPLGMRDTVFALQPEQISRLATVHQRKADGSLQPMPAEAAPPKPEFWAGGGRLYATAPDYLNFLRMVLGRGSLNGATVLRPETVAAMVANQTGGIDAGVMRTAMPERTNDFMLFPEMRCQWGLGWMITPQRGPDGRGPGSLTWGGIFNSYYWVDPRQQVAGIIMTQILPFADARALTLYRAFEHALYEALTAS